MKKKIISFALLLILIFQIIVPTIKDLTIYAQYDRSQIIKTSLNNSDFNYYGAIKKENDTKMKLVHPDKNGTDRGSATTKYALDLDYDFVLDFDVILTNDITANGFSVALVPESSYGSRADNPRVAMSDIPNSLFMAYKFYGADASNATNFGTTLNIGHTDENGNAVSIKQVRNKINDKENGADPDFHQTISYDAETKNLSWKYKITDIINGASEGETFEGTANIGSLLRDENYYLSINAGFKPGYSSTNWLGQTTWTQPRTDLYLRYFTGAFKSSLKESVNGNIVPGDNTINFNFRDYNASTYYDAIYKFVTHIESPDGTNNSYFISKIKSQGEDGQVDNGNTNLSVSKALIGANKDYIESKGKYIFPTEEEYLTDRKLILEDVDLVLDEEYTYQGLTETNNRRYNFSVENREDKIETNKDKITYDKNSSNGEITIDELINDLNLTITDGYVKTSTNQELINSVRFTVEDENGNPITSIPTTQGISKKVIFKYLSIDGDIITKEVEINIYDPDGDIDGDGIKNQDEIDNGLDPLVPNTGDTDKDGISDKDEVDGGTNPLKPDTDGDGINDKEEIDGGTDPTKPDTDGDGINDKDEIDNGLDPLVPNTGDTDGDGISDKDEIENGLDPLSPNTGDTDGDGISDKDEIELGLDPNNPNDGVSGKDEDKNIGKELIQTGKENFFIILLVSTSSIASVIYLSKKKFNK